MSALLRRYLTASKSILRQSACGPIPHGAKRPLVLHLERLEDRHLMNGDPVVVEAATGTTDIDVASLTMLDSIVLDDIGPVSFLPSQVHTAPAEEFDRIDELPDWLVAEADRRHGDHFGKQTSQFGYGYWGWNRWDGFVEFDTRTFAMTANESAGSFSTTNIQVAGVDEADLVETDGEFLYMISGKELLIIDVRDAEQPSISSRVQLESRPSGMYLDGDRLTLISQAGGGWYASPWQTGLIGSLVARDVAPGPSSWTPHSTQVRVLDISDATAPALVQHTEIDGRLVSSRMVDGQLRLVIQQEQSSWSHLLPNLQTHRVISSEANQPAEYRYETRDEYLARVHELLEHFKLPSYRTLAADGTTVQEQSLFDLEDLAVPIVHQQGSATTIATFNTRANNAGPSDTKTIFSASPAEIYATEDSLYLFGHETSNISGWRWHQATDIWKFDFDSTDSSITLSATGEVEGSFTSQFAADEHDGYLRIVTTDWRDGQNLFVLEQVGNQLEIAGEIREIAPGENLHSVRFLGNQAFAVTFRRIDPLFAIDLSDPENPFIAGELKIPGFSDYLQPIEEGYLLGVGRHADESSGWIQELQVSIFDVTDLDNPQLAHRYSFEGGSNTQTEALYVHQAVSYFPEAEILAIPTYNQSWSWWPASSSWSQTNESALQVFQIDVMTGFEPLATIKHDSRIMRSLRIGEQLVVVSADQVTIHDLDNPEQQLAELDLEIGSESSLVELTAYVAPETLTGLSTPRQQYRPTTRSLRSNQARPNFTPQARRVFTPTPRETPITTAELTVRDAATERLQFEPVGEAIDDQLAIDLAEFYTD